MVLTAFNGGGNKWATSQKGILHHGIKTEHHPQQTICGGVMYR